MQSALWCTAARKHWKSSISLKSTPGGPAAVAWRLEGEKDFVPANRTEFQIKAGTDWQTHNVSLPASGNVVHVRVHLPVGASSIRQVQVRHADP